MSESDIRDLTTAMNAAMSGENRRREVASATPGLGAQMHLEQPPSGPGVGISDVPGLDVQGEGYAVQAEITAAQVASYGPQRPMYAAPEVGGIGFQAGRGEPAIRHVTDLGDGRLFIEGRGAPGADPYVLVSPPAPRPSLRSRLLARLRRH